MQLPYGASERTRLKEEWHNNMFCVQAHAFNGSYESVDATVQDYLMSFRHEIISFKMMDRLVEYWLSNSILWHVDRGLKLGPEGRQPHGSESRGVLSQHQILSMNRFTRQSFESEARSCLYCVSCFKPGTLT